MHALIQHGEVWDLFDADPKLPADLDVRDVSGVAGIAKGWLARPDGTFAAPAVVVILLDAVKADLKGLIDGKAEALRLTLITPGSGQAMEYQEAYAEAVQVDAAVKAGRPVDPASTPMLAASLGYSRDPQTGQPSADIPGEARAVLAAYDAYQRAGAAIRNARLQAKTKVEQAATIEAARAAFDAAVWPTFA